MMQGGWKAWKRAGFPMAWDRVERQRRDFPFQENSIILATSDYVASRIKDFATVILDVRSRAEYDGTSQSHPASRFGHIPGAKWLEWTELLEEDHSFLPEALQREKLEKAGITSDKEILVYCHRGNRASNTFLALKALGYPKVKVYIGSWSDWAARLDLPLEKEETAPPEDMP
jgi:thiosulfate/3-mercaptopyruvate sulfurtransferase